MPIRIDDITKGTFSLSTPIDTRDRRLRIGVKGIGCWVGFYDLHEEQICQWRRDGRNSTEFKIDPVFYFFKDLSKNLKREVPGLNISLNKITGLIDLTLPEGVDLKLTDAIKYMIRLDDDEAEEELAGWLQGEYEGDRPVEFLPAGAISTYLDGVSTKSNLSTNKSGNMKNSNLFCNIQILSMSVYIGPCNYGTDETEIGESPSQGNPSEIDGDLDM